MASQAWKTKFATFTSTLGDIIESNKNFREDLDEDRSEPEDPAVALLKLLSDACQYVRELEASGHPDFDDIVKHFDKLLNSGVDVAYREMEVDFIRPFCFSDDAPLVHDQLKPEAGLSLDQREGFMKLVEMMRDILPAAGPSGAFKVPGEPSPWRRARLPHTSSSLLSRFRRPFQTSASDATPRAKMIYQARCEITTESIGIPSKMVISPNGACLAVAGAGGWKNRDPMLYFYMLDDDDDPLSSRTFVEPGLSDIARELTLDDERKLIFVADSHRVKSYTWEVGGKGKRGRAVHTLCSTKYEGPLAMLSNGRLMRVGKGSAAIWNLDEMDTHANKKLIGDKFKADDSWRESDEIERSGGNLPSTTVTFSDPNLALGAFHYYQPSSQFLCGYEQINEASETEMAYSCIQLDIEVGAKVTKRFLGHGGTITHISTSNADPNTFLTACSDGCVRLYDTRHALPTMTLDVGRQGEGCDAALLIHPDGIPTVFTGSDRGERVMLWDIRARKVVYELSTGNTSIQALAWDDRNSTLFAATLCMNVGYTSRTLDYRYAKKPDFTYRGDTESEAGEDVPPTEEEKSTISPKKNGRKRKLDEDGTLETDEVNEDEDDGEWGETGERHWPKRAYHAENAFGHFFDAAGHSIFSYQFKPEPDTNTLPESGWSSVDDGCGAFGLW